MKLYKVAIIGEYWYIVEAEGIKEAMAIANLYFPLEQIAEISTIPYKAILKADYPYDKAIKTVFGKKEKV
jgi:hypothetical protein